MEIFLLALIIGWLLFVSIIVRGIMMRVTAHHKAIRAHSWSINITSLDLAHYVTTSLQEKAKHTSLTEEERQFFSKAHEAIPRIEAALKELQ